MWTQGIEFDKPRPRRASPCTGTGRGTRAGVNGFSCIVGEVGVASQESVFSSGRRSPVTCCWCSSCFTAISRKLAPLLSSRFSMPHSMSFLMDLSSR
ncbi:hypothetical protein EYF80_059734 [Liparis tanakae]|uniref:Uncharacterized protein n=1 Tax=Liparis tanakae TaxID=230148 RepID=A0A4Z2EMU2_9TELE|nr:hypothetical protein EYF80_059734 [Liparis tanakae]